MNDMAGYPRHQRVREGLDDNAVPGPVIAKSADRIRLGGGA